MPYKYEFADFTPQMLKYFKWSVSALVPVQAGEADLILRREFDTIWVVAQTLLKQINYAPGPIYRGVIFKQPMRTPNFNTCHFPHADQ